MIKHVRRTNWRVKGKDNGSKGLGYGRAYDGNNCILTGSFRGTPVKKTITFIGRPTSAGVLHGKGKGVIMAGESEMATYTGEGIGRISPAGDVRWRGSHFFSTSSNGRLAFLNTVVGLFEAEIDSEGNATEKIWEWK